MELHFRITETDDHKLKVDSKTNPGEGIFADGWTHFTTVATSAEAGEAVTEEIDFQREREAEDAETDDDEEGS